MIADATILDHIDRCGDLWVRLTNRHGTPTYTESYNLSTLMLCGPRVWGKFRPVHSPLYLREMMGRDLVHPGVGVSYHYNNFARVVCSSSMATNSVRMFSSHTYRSMEFVSRGTFRPLWTRGRDTTYEPIAEAVRRCHRLKARVVADGYTYIVPIHTMEAWDDGGGFSCQTEYDAFPDLLRYFTRIAAIEENLDRGLGEAAEGESNNFLSNHEPFFGTYFCITSEQIYHMDFASAAWTAFTADEVSIWGEDAQ